MSPIHEATLPFILLLIQSASCCNSVNEFESRSVTATNSTHIGYQFPQCPELYHLATIVRAQLSSPATPQSNNPLDITDFLATSCLGMRATPCTVDVPLNGFRVPGGITTLDVKVNYTCELDDPDWIRSLVPASKEDFSQTSWVKYIRVKLTGAQVDWNCTISSSGGSAVSWSWMLENCPMNAFRCMDRTLVVLPAQSDHSSFCMQPQSIGGTWFIAEKYCDTMPYTSIVIDIQVPLDSDFNIECNPQTPSNIAENIENPTDPLLDALKSKCSQMAWTGPLPSTSKDLSTSTSRTTLARNSENNFETTPTRNSETSVGIAVTAEQKFYATMHVTSLGLGLGLGLGLLVILSAVVLAVICIRRKNRGFDAKDSTLSNGGATAEKDGGFVLATDAFVMKNIYSDISEINLNPNPSKQIHEDAQVKSQCASDINNSNGVEGYNNSQFVPTEETVENGYDQESTSPAAASVPPGDRKSKRASSLSRKLFKQIAVLAKQEERQSQIPDGGVATGRPEGAVEVGGSELSIVDRWLYSSNLNSVENTLTGNRSNDNNDAIYINRRFEIDI